MDNALKSRSGRVWLVPGWAMPLMLLALGVGISYISADLWPRVKSVAPNAGVQQVDVRFSACASGLRTNCVVDGDTIWVSGEKIRLADIDTPEVFSPECADELQRGLAASRRLTDLINQGTFTLRPATRPVDKYGRALKIAERGGQSLGMILVREGLARRWDGARHSWCA